MKFIAVRALFFFLVFQSLLAFSQSNQVYRPEVSRILFVLDGSGSMRQLWDGRTKFDRAKDLLAKIIDSVERKNSHVEFAVRVFGYQSLREQRNCSDSKLLVPFAKNNAQHIREALSGISPQGMSPIASSIQLGAGDFPDDVKSLNSIVLITDGEENCGGDPCKISSEMIAKRITLKPFIVGLNVDSSKYERYKCIGTFYQAADETSLYNTVGIIIKQTLNTTTAQINLLDAVGNPTITNIAFTLYDHTTGKVQYNFIHTLNEKGNPDTLFLDPVGIYDLELHTYPSIRKEGIELTPGKHNIIALDVPVGSFEVSCPGATVSNNNAQVVVRDSKDRSILNVQDFNENENYLSTDYRFQILTNPVETFDTLVIATTDNRLKVRNYGTLSVMADNRILISVLFSRGGMQKEVLHFRTDRKTENRHLQPGNYLLVYKSGADYDSESTKTKEFTIEEGRVQVINLRQ